MSHGGDDELHEEHEEHVNHEAWVIPYADLLTLLMAMFIALFAMSTVDITKFKKLAIGFNEALGGGKLDSGIGGASNKSSPAFGQGNGTGALSSPTALSPQSPTEGKSLADILSQYARLGSAKALEKATLADVKLAIEQRAAKGGFSDKLVVEERNNGLLVTLVTDKILFKSGQATVLDRADGLLQLIAEALNAVDNKIKITGYTDSDPLNRSDGYDNYDLSFARAKAVMYELREDGVDVDRMTPDGLGDRNEVASNTTEAGKALNRRVEIFVESKLVDETLKQNLLDDAPTPPTTLPITPPVTSGVGASDPGVNPGLGAGN
jgi:chemotaxis protein MotB